MRILAISILTLALWGCGQPAEETTAPAASEPAAAKPMETAEEPADRLAGILADQPAEVRARYQYRHPQETLEFFGIKPGMTVVEALPGGGWYSKILIPYLGSDGTLIGADYARDMYANFDFADEEFMEAKLTWAEDWPAMAMEWHDGDGADVKGFAFGSLPESMHGSADAVLLIRALHNLARFNADDGYLDQAIADSFDVLKPGGIVGVVQHHARDDMPDDWAGGQNGYLKTGFVIEQMEAAGFEYVGSSDVNANERDQPTTSDIVWRLPPSLATSQDNPELRATLEAVGESNRMTLLFRKPG